VERDAALEKKPQKSRGPDMRRPRKRNHLERKRDALFREGKEKMIGRGPRALLLKSGREKVFMNELGQRRGARPFPATGKRSSFI